MILAALLSTLWPISAQTPVPLSQIEVGDTEDQRHQLHEAIEFSERLAELGAGYEAVRIIAAIAQQSSDEELMDRTKDILQHWNLSIESIQELSAEEIAARINAATAQSQSEHNDFVHLENLFHLQQFEQAAAILYPQIADRKMASLDGHLRERLAAMGIRDDREVTWTESSLADAFRKAHHHRTLRNRIRQLRTIDPELGELAMLAWHHHSSGDSHREFDEEDRLPPLSDIFRELRRRVTSLDLDNSSALATIADLLRAFEDQSRRAQQWLSEFPPIAPPNKPQVTMRQPEGKDPGREVFETPSVRQYEIELSEEAVTHLREEPKQYVRGTFIGDGARYENVGIRLKGGRGSFRELDEGYKTAFTIKFNQFKKGQRFMGLRRIVLNNAVQDPSYFREALGYSIFREAGIPAPRISYATVKVNGQAKGLYVQVEAITKDFLKRWYSQVDGNLYEGPGDVTDWRELDLDSNRDREDRSDLRRLTRMIEEADDLDPWKTLSEEIDYNHFVRFLAVEQILNHWDGYTQVNNYRLYRNPATERFEFLPHGGDQLFENPFEPVFRSQGGILGRALLLTERGKEDFTKVMNTILESTWDEERLRQRITNYYLLLRPHLNKANSLNRLDAFEETVRHVIRFVSSRATVIRHHLRQNNGSASWRERQHFEEELHFLFDREWE